MKFLRKNLFVRVKNLLKQEEAQGRAEENACEGEN